MNRNSPATVTLPARIALVFGLLASGFLAMRLLRDSYAKVHREFVQEIDAHAASIDAQISEDVAVIHSLKALFDASEVVTRVEFCTFSSFLLGRYPSMRAVGWVPRITTAERSAAELRAQGDGLDGFQITEVRQQGDMVPAAPREEYYPVYYIEPLEGNQAALAFDLASSPVRRKALEACRDSGKEHATGRMTLVQERANAWSVLLFVPVYDGRPTTVDERRSSIRGVVSGVFRIDDLLAAAGVIDSGSDMIDIHLIDEDADARSEVLYDAGLARGDLAVAHRYEKRLKPAGGRRWVLVATPTVAYVAGKRSAGPMLGFCGGLLLTVLLTYYLHRLAREKQRVETQVNVRTRELQAQGAALAETNANLEKEIAERRLLQKRFADVTDHEQRRLGQELHDSLGQQIAVTALLAQSLKERLAAPDAATVRHLDRLTKSAQSAQAQVRALSKGLLPVEIDRWGLKAALQQLTASTKGLSDVTVDFECDGDVVVESSSAATHLYRIAQEALRNALEHGQVSRATLSLVGSDKGVTLTCRDDGHGFNTAPSTSAGAGLASMRYRAELIGATFDIDSKPGIGTSARCFLPHGAPPPDSGPP